MIRKVLINDLERCYEIESVAYEGDEAATKEKIEKRILTYPEGFIVLEQDGEVVGFINSGATDDVQLSDEDFKELVGHTPDGKFIVIMSVVVHPDHQRKGYAGMLMVDFIKRMRALGKQSIYLICQADLMKFYSTYGFEHIGKSDSEHGGLSWHEMVLSL